MFDYSKLKGKIKEVFGTQEAFAEAMDMTQGALSQRLNNTVSWKPVEIVKACALLYIPLSDSWLYFFTLKV